VGDYEKNPVCKAILAFIAAGKKGADIRGEFESAPYGWSHDAVDGGLQVLLVAGLVKALDEHGKVINFQTLERKSISKVMFKVESVNLTTAQYIQIRKLMQQIGLSSFKQGEEIGYAPQFIQKMTELAEQAGGEAPKPVLPDISFLDEIRIISGNEQLLAIFNQREMLGDCLKKWSDLADLISKRWPSWLELKRLIAHASDLENAETILTSVKTIEEQRQLLDDPDVITPLIAELTQKLREKLNKLNNEYESNFNLGNKRLEEDVNWQQLEEEKRYQLKSQNYLHNDSQPEVNVQTTKDVLATLDKCNLSMFSDRLAALSGRFDNAALGAAELCEPKAQFIKVPHCTLKTPKEIDFWVENLKRQLKTALEKGPVVVK
jgi:hypothetical protein